MTVIYEDWFWRLMFSHWSLTTLDKYFFGHIDGEGTLAFGVYWKSLCWCSNPESELTDDTRFRPWSGDLWLTKWQCGWSRCIFRIWTWPGSQWSCLPCVVKRSAHPALIASPCFQPPLWDPDHYQTHSIVSLLAVCAIEEPDCHSSKHTGQMSSDISLN